MSEIHDYHIRQYKKTYRSTEKFHEWLLEFGVLDKGICRRVLDVGCGMGANTFFFATNHRDIKFHGVDIDHTLVREGMGIIEELKVSNCILSKADLYNFDNAMKNSYNGIISLQTLSWLEGFEEPIDSMISLNPEWIAMSSLFFEGYINSKVMLDYYDESLKKTREAYYNVYSIPLVKEYLSSKGYSDFRFKRFDIDIDLEPKDPRYMGTYTKRISDGSRIQISGPMLMNWYFIFARKVQ